MNKSLSWLMAGALVFTLGAGFVLGFFLQRGPRLGYVDPSRVWADSELGKQYRQQVAAKEKELNDRFAKLTNEQKVQQRDQFLAERNQLESSLLSKFQGRMNKEAQALGKKYGLDAVFTQSVMIYGQRDLTAEIAKALDKE